MTTPGPLAALRARLSAPRGRARIDALLADDDAANQVAALAPNALHELVIDIGLADAGPLLALATPEQIQGCLDLEAWDRDRIDLAPTHAWIAALVELGFEKVGQVWHGLDAEWRALYLQRQAVIYDLTGGEDPDHDATYVDDADAPPVWFTPDGAFAVRLLGGEDQARLTMALVADLYRADMALARHTLLAARSEPPAELEEQSYRWRSGRMSDLGYVDFYEALALFAPLSPEQYLAETSLAAPALEDGPPLPRIVVEHLVTRSFLAQAWDRVADDPAVATQLETALLSLVNHVLAAARVRPGDGSALAAAADYATATVSLGLESVARGDVVRGGELLATASLERLHRVGYTATQRLAKVAAAIAPRAATADDAARAVIEALAGGRPWLARAIDDPPATGVRPFASLIDVRRAAEVLTRLALRITVAERLGVVLVGTARAAEQPALDDHVRTALVRWMGGGDLAAHAVSIAEVQAARAALARGVDRGAALTAARALVGDDGGLTPALGPLVNGWLDELADTLAALDGDVIDPRFVDGVLVTPPTRA